MTNNDMPRWLRPLLMRALIDIMEGRSPATLDRPRYAELDSQNVDFIAGTYSVPEVGSVTIYTGDTEAAQDPIDFTVVASLRVDSGLEHDVYFVGEGQLYVPGMSAGIGVRETPEPFRYIDWLSVFHVAEGERVGSSPVP